MRASCVGLLLTLALAWLGQPAYAQKVNGQTSTQDVPKGCLIVKHKGTVGRRLIYTVLIGVPIAPGANYDLVDSVDYKPKKVAYKGKELQAVEQQGVHVIVLEKNYKTESLDAARKSCQLAFPSAPAPPAPAPEDPASQAVLDFWSSPSGADIFVDGGYVGKTPYSLVVTPGQHTISLLKKDFGAWQRKMLVEVGKSKVGANLEQESLTLQ